MVIGRVHIYDSTFQAKGDQEIPYNFITLKPESYYMIRIAISNYPEKEYIISTHKNLDSFYDCRVWGGLMYIALP